MEWLVVVAFVAFMGAMAFVVYEAIKLGRDD